MNKATISLVFFMAIFVSIVVFISEYFIPNISIIISATKVGLSALVSGFIGLKLFPVKS